MPKPKPHPGLIPPNHEPTLANLIRHERERLEKTQSEVAKIMKVHRNSYIQLEGSGGREANPTVNTLRKLKAAGFDLRRIVPELFD